MGMYNIDTFNKKDYDKSKIKYRFAVDKLQEISDNIPSLCQDIITVANTYKVLVTQQVVSDEWVDDAIAIVNTANDTSTSLKKTSVSLVKDVTGMIDSIETDNRRLQSSIDEKKTALSGILEAVTGINIAKATPPAKNTKPTEKADGTQNKEKDASSNKTDDANKQTGSNKGDSNNKSDKNQKSPNGGGGSKEDNASDTGKQPDSASSPATGNKDIDTLRNELGLHDGNGNSNIDNKFGYYNKDLTERQTKLLNSLDTFGDSVGLTQAQKSDWAYIIGRESGFKTEASNGTHFGIGQLTSDNVQKYASDPSAYMSGDANVQLSATYNYIMDRYGSIEKAREHWAKNNWY